MSTQYGVSFNPETFGLDYHIDIWDCNEFASTSVVLHAMMAVTCPGLTYIGESGGVRRIGVLRIGRWEDKAGIVKAVLIDIEM